jgi:hypothetical protein
VQLLYPLLHTTSSLQLTFLVVQYLAMQPFLHVHPVLLCHGFASLTQVPGALLVACGPELLTGLVLPQDNNSSTGGDLQASRAVLKARAGQAARATAGPAQAPATTESSVPRGELMFMFCMCGHWMQAALHQALLASRRKASSSSSSSSRWRRRKRRQAARRPQAVVGKAAPSSVKSLARTLGWGAQQLHLRLVNKQKVWQDQDKQYIGVVKYCPSGSTR